MGIGNWALCGPCDWPITLNSLLLLDNMLITFTLYLSERMKIEQLNKYEERCKLIQSVVILLLYIQILTEKRHSIVAKLYATKCI